MAQVSSSPSDLWEYKGIRGVTEWHRKRSLWKLKFRFPGAFWGQRETKERAKKQKKNPRKSFPRIQSSKLGYLGCSWKSSGARSLWKTPPGLVLEPQNLGILPEAALELYPCQGKLLEKLEICGRDLTGKILGMGKASRVLDSGPPSKFQRETQSSAWE